MSYLKAQGQRDKTLLRRTSKLWKAEYAGYVDAAYSHFQLDVCIEQHSFPHNDAPHRQ